MAKYKRTNQAKKNRATRIDKLSNKIMSELGIMSSDRRNFQKILTKNINTGGVKTLKRLNKISGQIKSNTFNFNRYVGQVDLFKSISLEVRKDLGLREVLSQLYRTDFYKQNRELITQYNKEYNAGKVSNRTKDRLEYRHKLKKHHEEIEMVKNLIKWKK